MKTTRPLRTRITRRFYRHLFGVYRLVFPTSARAGPVAPAHVRRLLIARVDRVGDLVVLSPALSYLRDVLPDAEIDLLASPGNASLLQGDARLTTLYVHEPTLRGWLRSVRRLRARRYDAVFTVRLRDHAYEGLFAALVAGRRGVRFTGRRPPQYAGFFTHQVHVPRSRGHIVARLLYLARALLGDLPAPPIATDLATHPPSLPASPEAEARARDFAAAAVGVRPYIALNAWGSDPRRSFGVPYAAAVAAAAARHRPGLAVIITAPPGREDEAAEIAARATAELAGASAGQQASPSVASPSAGPVVAAPTSRDLRDLVAFIRHAAVVVTPDTANVHIACALGRPLVAVYTSLAVTPEVWGAWGTRAHVVFLPERRPMADVPVAEVLAALDVALDGPADAILGDHAAPTFAGAAVAEVVQRLRTRVVTGTGRAPSAPATPPRTSGPPPG